MYGYINFKFLDCIFTGSVLNVSLVTTAWRVLRLRMEETVPRYGG
jgi:hypothetical protein